MSHTKTKIFAIISILMMVAGVAVCAFSLIFMRSEDHSAWINTNGMLNSVVEKQKNYDGVETLYEQKISYTTDKGKQISITMPYVGPVAPAAGESIDIAYNPSEPSQAELVTLTPPEQPPLQTFMLLGAGLVALGAFTFWYAKARSVKI